MSDRARKPVPKPAPESVPYWEAAKRHRLELPKCNACGKFWFPPSQSCPHCLAADFAFKPVSGRGKVYSFVTFHRVYHPAFAGEVPYVVALVELEEGPRLLSNIVGVKPDAVACEMPVKVVFDDVGGRRLGAEIHAGLIGISAAGGGCPCARRSGRPGRPSRPAEAAPGAIAVVAQVDRVGRHGRGDRVLVDDLLLAIALQQHAERVKPGHHALQPNTVGEKNRDRRPPAQEVIEKGILKSVDIIFSHFLLFEPALADFRPQTRQHHDASQRCRSKRVSPQPVWQTRFIPLSRIGAANKCRRAQSSPAENRGSRACDRSAHAGTA